MTKARNQRASENGRESARRIRLSSKRDSHLGKSLRRAYNGGTDCAMPDDFAELLARLG